MKSLQARTKNLLSLCEDCETLISSQATRCKSCAGKQQSNKIDWPDVNTLKTLVKKTSYLQVARSLGVSDNAVRKRIKNHSS
jgi:RNA polymerase subunit RPABC4/transcription elongation factor Spt4